MFCRDSEKNVLSTPTPPVDVFVFVIALLMKAHVARMKFLNDSNLNKMVMTWNCNSPTNENTNFTFMIFYLLF